MPVRSPGMDSRLYLTVNRFVVDHDAIGGIFAVLETWAVPLFAAATVGLWFLDRPGARRKWKLASASALASAGFALLVAQLLGRIWPRERPFMATASATRRLSRGVSAPAAITTCSLRHVASR